LSQIGQPQTAESPAGFQFGWDRSHGFSNPLPSPAKTENYGAEWITDPPGSNPKLRAKFRASQPMFPLPVYWMNFLEPELCLDEVLT